MTGYCDNCGEQACECDEESPICDCTIPHVIIRDEGDDGCAICHRPLVEQACKCDVLDECDKRAAKAEQGRMLTDAEKVSASGPKLSKETWDTLLALQATYKDEHFIVTIERAIAVLAIINDTGEPVEVVKDE